MNEELRDTRNDDEILRSPKSTFDINALKEHYISTVLGEHVTRGMVNKNVEEL